MDNPFFTEYGTPFGAIPYNNITLEHFVPAVKEGIRLECEAIERICNESGAATFENTIEALEYSGVRLSVIIGAFNALVNARSYDEILAVEEEIELLCTAHRNNMSLNSRLFERVKAVYEGEREGLDAAQNRLLDETYMGFVRSGANLKGADRERYRVLTERLATLAIKYQENCIKDTDGFTLHVTEVADLSGIPADVVEAARNNAVEGGLEGWLFTLHRPSYIPFMTFCRNRGLRQQMYMAYSTIGAKGNGHDNRAIVVETVNARLELARMLGYGSYSEYVLAERMAKNTDAVFSMLGRLTWAYLPVARKEIDEIKEFARECEGENFEFKPWDFAFYSERLKEKRFKVNDDEVRQYFELNQCIYGMFYVATRLYGLTFKQNHDIPVFNPDVKVWEVYDYDGSYLALLYCDFFARKGKHAGAWMDSITPQYKDKNGNDHRPHITLSTNYRKPMPGKPTLLNYDEFNTLMHEFGHCLHGILSNVTYPGQCSPNVLWDFVEMPSQIMENFASEEAVLKHFAFHHETGADMPQKILDGVKAAARFNVGYQCVRQVGLGLIDQAWHNIREPFCGDVIEYEHMATAALRVMEVVPGTCMTPNFGHIMSGGYAAGYYSYKWAEMLDADAYSLFKENGVLDMKTAQSFRDNILSRGDSEHPMTLYMRFRGHEPHMEAMLQRDGINTICPHL